VKTRTQRQITKYQLRRGRSRPSFYTACTQLGRSLWCRRTAAKGLEERFPRRRLSGRYGFSNATLCWG
jgi:hypothetical protein